MIYDRHDRVEGKLLLSYCLIENKYVDFVPHKTNNVFPSFMRVDMSLYSLGIRNLKKLLTDSGGSSSKCSVELRTSAPHHKKIDSVKQASIIGNCAEALPIQYAKPSLRKVNRSSTCLANGLQGDNDDKESDSGESADQEAHELNRQKEYAELLDQEENERLVYTREDLFVVDEAVTLNQIHEFSLNVPFNKAVCPVLEVYLYKHTWNKKTLFASGSLNMASSLAWFYGEEDEHDYRAKWKALFKIGKVEIDGDDTEKPQRLKFPTIRPENKLLYLDDLIYELPKADTLKTKKAQKRYLGQSRADSREASHQTSAQQSEIERFKVAGDEGEPVPEGNKAQISSASDSGMIYEADYGLYNRFKRITEMLQSEDLNELTKEEQIRVVADLHAKGQLAALGVIEEEEYSHRSPTAKDILADRRESRTWQISVMNPASPSRLLDSPFTRQKSEQKSVNQSRDSFQMTKRLNEKESEDDDQSERMIRRLELREDDEIQSLQADISNKSVKYEDLFVPAPPEAKKQEAKFIEDNAKKSSFSLFNIGKNWFSKRKEKEQYIDFVV